MKINKGSNQTVFKYIKVIIKQRWAYYVFGYLFGYILGLIEDGINFKNLFPIKTMAIVLSMLLGNVSYYILVKKLSRAEMQEKAFKYTIITLLMFLVMVLFQKLILAVWGFDIYPFI